MLKKKKKNKKNNIFFDKVIGDPWRLGNSVPWRRARVAYLQRLVTITRSAWRRLGSQRCYRTG